jgi:hypothetical protein
VNVEHTGAARTAKLTLQLGGSTADLQVTADDLTGWPTGIAYPFYGVIDRGYPTEEKILFSERLDNILIVFSDGLTVGRGVDDTSITTHAVNANIEHIFTATEAQNASDHIETSSLHIPVGDQTVTICTSTTRPGAPEANQLIFETDTKLLYAYVDSVWVALQSNASVDALYLMGG